MIRINLLPVREARRQVDIRNQGMLLGMAAAAGLVLCVMVHIGKSAQISAQRTAVGVARGELASLDTIRKQVERFKSEQEDIESKLAVIATLEKSRSGPVRILDEIATRIPKRLWLTKLSMKGGVLRLAGVSLDAEIVAAFLTELEESPIISRVELEETRLQEMEGLKLNSFKVRSSYQYGVPLGGTTGNGSG